MLDLNGDAGKSGVIETLRQAGECVTLPSILVVDDNPLIVDLIMHLFRDRFDIEPAGSADAALDRVGIRAYDLVLIDLVLPEMNGLELYREIRSINRTQRVVLMSAYQGAARVGQVINEDVSGCIFKPFSVDVFEDLMTGLLKQPI